MSLLMFSHSPDNVMILTDTLATDTDGSPMKFASKCQAIPHLGMAVAITGIEQLGTRWIAALQEQILARDIEMLDRYAPEVLSETWKGLIQEHDLVGVSATIYHFGQAESTGEYVAYAYRSTDGFASELLGYGFGIKPPPASMQNLVLERTSDLVALAETIRVEQDALDPGERLYIGGALILTVLHDGAITSSEIHRFEDCDEAWNEMNRLRIPGTA